jgi:hypothetical protein
MEIAISEPHFYGIHGGTKSIPHYMVVYSYTLDEYFNHEWQDDYKVVLRNVRQSAHRLPFQHDLIRAYKYNIGSHVSLNLVQIYRDSENRDLCILHTYKLNIFRRIWRNRRIRRRQL